MEVVEFPAVGEGDGVVEGAVDDEDRFVDLFDAVDIWKLVAGEEGNGGDGAEGGEEGGEEDEAGGVLAFGEPAGGAGADGLADDEDAGGGDFFLGEEVGVGGLDGGVAAGFVGGAFAESEAGVVVGEEAEAFGGEFAVEGDEGPDVLGVAVGPEEDGAVWFGGRIPEGGDLFALAAGQHLQTGGVRGVLTCLGLEDEFVGEAAGGDGEDDVDEGEGFEGALPVPLTEDPFSPLHASG